MKPLPVAEIRERFLRFFESRGHARLPSDSLVPANDPTLLFTGAGMNQFKDMFLGKGALPHRRVTTVQKCLRVPDLENVGRTPRHHTFFEMLGNFSFGDYFKKECIAWEWEFFSKELDIPECQMVATVYEDDDEAYDIWTKDIGLEPERVFRFGEKENFWPAEAPSKGPNGPCGPCSEIYFDNAPEQPYPSPDGLRELPEDRFTEIGNCVFTQFDRQEDGSLAPLPQKNIDVGLGLERIAAVLAGAPNNFEIDVFAPLIAAVSDKARIRYGEDPVADIRMRRIADHIRALVFCIADGALPSNEGRGYVVRKILRRASRDAIELGIGAAFLHSLVDTVAEVMGDAYPEIREHATLCRDQIRGEEKSFAVVYESGMRRLLAFLADAKPGEGVLAGSGEFAFELHDTFGFPADLSQQVMADAGFRLDDDGFRNAMEDQKRRGREGKKTVDDVFADSVAMVLRSAGVVATRFCGYEEDACEAIVGALLSAEHEVLDRAAAGSEVVLVVDATPFYAQGGGQAGDRGVLKAESGEARIVNTTGLEGYHLHQIEVTKGELEPGQRCTLEVDVIARRATERHHTATHLLHAALKNVLGAHVHQTGSEVSPERLRFDFNHGEKLTAEQVQEIERQVNDVVAEAIDVRAEVRATGEAKAAGFIAMFGEKYGEQVRTLAVGDFSKELCGGTHVRNTGQIGLFRIVSETAISAGNRRIEAVSGYPARELANRDREIVGELAALLKVQRHEVTERVLLLADEAKKLRKQLEKATAVDLGTVLRELEAAAVAAEGVTCAVFRRDGLKMKEVQELLKRATKLLAPFAGVVFSIVEGQVLVGAAVSKAITDRVQAGPLVLAATGAMGGGGGGRPEMAQGTGTDATALANAERAVRALFAEAGLAAPLWPVSEADGEAVQH